jgi:arsenate reductase
MKSILFICTHNSARSQMAEGLVNHFFGEKWSAKSAGTEATKVKPEATEAMKQLGVDISHHSSKIVSEFQGTIFDVVVTVCDSAQETCPFFPGNKVVHKSFVDPSDTDGEFDKRVEAFAKTRNEILKWLEDFLPENE